MKKKTLIITGVAIAIIAALAAGLFWFIQYNQKTISREQASSIAIKDANLQEADITRFTWKLDNENGVQVYELEFYHGTREYDYDINATTGAILKKEVDASRR